LITRRREGAKRKREIDAERQSFQREFVGTAVSRGKTSSRLRAFA
jgi:hypothetical protein